MFSHPPHLFVYGSLLRRPRLTEVLGHPHDGEQLRARLRGYARISVPGFDYPALLPDEQAGVDGMLLMDLSVDDLRALDAYEETDQGLYERVPVDVTCYGCGPLPSSVAAQTYVAGSALRARLAAAGRGA